MTVPRKAAGVPDAASLAAPTILVSRQGGSHGPAGELAPEQLVHADAAPTVRTGRLADLRCRGQPLGPSLVPAAVRERPYRRPGCPAVTYPQGVGPATPLAVPVRPRRTRRSTIGAAAATAGWARLGARDEAINGLRPPGTCGYGREGFTVRGGTTLAARARNAPHRWGAANIARAALDEDEEMPSRSRPPSAAGGLWEPWRTGRSQPPPGGLRRPCPAPLFAENRAARQFMSRGSGEDPC
jgi:hypothetical protein